MQRKSQGVFREVDEIPRRGGGVRKQSMVTRGRREEQIILCYTLKILESNLVNKKTKKRGKRGPDRLQTHPMRQPIQIIGFDLPSSFRSPGFPLPGLLKASSSAPVFPVPHSPGTGSTGPALAPACGETGVHSHGRFLFNNDNSKL